LSNRYASKRVRKSIEKELDELEFNEQEEKQSSGSISDRQLCPNPKLNEEMILSFSIEDRWRQSVSAKTAPEKVMKYGLSTKKVRNKWLKQRTLLKFIDFIAQSSEFRIL
jgi:hypothetical protein